MIPASRTGRLHVVDDPRRGITANAANAATGNNKNPASAGPGNAAGSLKRSQTTQVTS